MAQDEPLGCTQPKGEPRTVGWSYDLKPGTYRIVLVVEEPPAHGYGANDQPDAWKGKLISNEVTLTIGK